MASLVEICLLDMMGYGVLRQHGLPSDLLISISYHEQTQGPMPPLRLSPKSRLRLLSFGEVPQRDSSAEYLTTRTFREGKLMC